MRGIYPPGSPGTPSDVTAAHNSYASFMPIPFLGVNLYAFLDEGPVTTTGEFIKYWVLRQGDSMMAAAEVTHSGDRDGANRALARR